MKALISVIVPIVYGGKDYIDRCIDSLLFQSEKNYELIFAVSNPDEYTLNRCMKLQDEVKNVICVREKSEMGRLRSIGMKLSSGKYIAFIDVDDCYKKDFLEKMINPLESDNEIDFSECNVELFWDDGQVKEWKSSLKPGINKLNFSGFRAAEIGGVWNKVYRREFLERKKLLEMWHTYYEDNAYSIQLSGAVNKLYFVEEPLYRYYRSNANSYTKTYDKYESFFSAMEYAILYLCNINQFWNNYATLGNYILINDKTGIFPRSGFSSQVEMMEERFYSKFFPQIADDLVYWRKHQKSKEIVVIGAGNIARQFVKRNSDNIVAVIDNDKEKAGKPIGGFVTEYAEEFFNNKYKGWDIVIASNYYLEISEQLKKKNIRNYVFYPEYERQVWGGDQFDYQ